MKLYGIRNCDTVKKARKWLGEQRIEYQFHDFKKDGLSTELLATWEHSAGWEALLTAAALPGGHCQRAFVRASMRLPPVTSCWTTLLLSNGPWWSFRAR